ncbi:ParB domain-containing protein [Balamuthia mandrillaris]
MQDPSPPNNVAEEKRETPLQTTFPCKEESSVATKPRKPTQAMPLQRLTVTQSGIRDVETCTKMAEFVAGGGSFSFDNMKRHSAQVFHQQARDKEIRKSRPAQPKLVLLACLPDGQVYVWDGHHRVAAIYLGRREELLQEEYYLFDCSYTFVNSPHLAQWYLTPHDPRTEIRVAEFGSYKKTIAKLLKGKNDKAAIADIISSHKHMYAEPRTISTIAELVDKMGLKRVKTAATEGTLP